MYMDYLENRLTGLFCLPEVPCDLRGWLICYKPILNRQQSPRKPVKRGQRLGE